jgi:hypothetical protein
MNKEQAEERVRQSWYIVDERIAMVSISIADKRGRGGSIVMPVPALHLGTEYAKKVTDNAFDALLTLAMERGCSIFDGVMETDMGSISLQDGIELIMEAKTFDDREDVIIGYHA